MNESGFCLQYNAAGYFLCKSNESGEMTSNLAKAQAMYAFNQLIEFVECANNGIVIYDITYHSSTTHRIDLIYFEKKAEQIGSFLRIEKEYTTLESLLLSLAEDFSNLLAIKP
ncbi:MAG: hypothetical protein FWG91_00690 [Lachnospiraceae bacterium]|nr:hypothetical protein [Lachnospiraceae bacterium]